ncbi:carbohydrate ABC transporter substrate-binding protein (CUT1 family) [Kineothrix alysoides]|uniref:Carbohydrate ABC transporter substrate-binding protein (CUT1 family) n=1 Tax=Kineothrix alysoides TaxID=1469948 RepID=A0A4R1R3V0_9FIRM|nr:extracellular solute-binding protein [Kineothrix alysoides]TCL60114.1 carbohydrate ABC transporter substrate-binding protein (CUT1 family) [Kineothrix alysoides]
MKNSKSFMAVILCMLIVLSGCGAQNGTAAPVNDVESSTQEESAKKEITLKTVSMFGATDPALEVYNQTVEQFKKDNSNIKIVDESSASNEEWKSRIKADFAVGNEPDVILYFTDANSYELIEKGSFVDIETIRKDYPDFVDHIFPHTFTNAPDGKQYAVPTRGFYEALFCNKDLFDQYNLELPTSWDKLLTAVETFNQNGIVPFAVSFSDVPHYMIEHLVLAAGGIDDHKAVPASPDEIPDSWITGMEQLRVLNDMGAFPVDVNATTYPLVGEMFYGKQAAMTIDGSWFMGGIEDKENVVVMPFPSMVKENSEEIIAGFTSGWYITKKAWDDPDKRQACVDFVEMVSSPEFLAKITTVAPCEIPVPSDMTVLDQSGFDTFVNAGEKTDLPIDSRIAGEAWNAWVTSIGSIAEGEKQAKEVLTEVIDIFNKK